MSVPVKPAMAQEGTSPTGAWADAIALLGEDLRRRDAAERTQRAYAVDLRQFAQWAGDGGISPEEVDPKTVRRYIAHLSEGGASGRRAAPATSARKLAALRALF